MCVMCVCNFVKAHTRERERPKERARACECECVCVCVCLVIGMKGAVGGVERQDVVAIEGKCRRVIGLC